MSPGLIGGLVALGIVSIVLFVWITLDSRAPTPDPAGDALREWIKEMNDFLGSVRAAPEYKVDHLGSVERIGIIRVEEEA